MNIERRLIASSERPASAYTPPVAQRQVVTDLSSVAARRNRRHYGLVRKFRGALLDQAERMRNRDARYTHLQVASR